MAAQRWAGGTRLGPPSQLAEWLRVWPTEGPLVRTLSRKAGVFTLARALLLVRSMVVALVQVRLHTAAVVGAGPPAAALWQRLRRGFPWTVAAVLRGRSLVWLGRVPRLSIARQSMERVLSPTRRRLGWPRIDLDIREVAAPRVGLIARQVHGPVSEDPTSCALLPGWSTARDLLGLSLIHI